MVSVANIGPKLFLVPHIPLAELDAAPRSSRSACGNHCFSKPCPVSRLEPAARRASRGDHACLERARCSQPADRRLTDVKAPRDVSLRFAVSKPLNRLLPLLLPFYP